MIWVDSPVSSVKPVASVTALVLAEAGKFAVTPSYRKAVALLVWVVWLVCLVWVVPYGQDGENLELDLDAWGGLGR